MASIKRKKCCNCKDLFIPDPRNAERQKYCCKPECRKASKAASQERWLAKPENQGYFSGPENVKRVQRWRKAHPGYWRGKRKNKQDALQDSLNAQHAENYDDNTQFGIDPLQDFLIAQPPVLLGLIANFTGNALQDDMVMTLKSLQRLGQDIVSTHSKGGHYDRKSSDHCRTGPENTQALQLDRPSRGP